MKAVHGRWKNYPNSQYGVSILMTGKTTINTWQRHRHVYQLLLFHWWKLSKIYLIDGFDPLSKHQNNPVVFKKRNNVKVLYSS